MNPFRQLEKEIQEARNNLTDVLKVNNQLRNHNRMLIDENIQLENNLTSAKEGVEELCDKCSFQAGQQCRECPINKFATTNNLWKEA